MSSKIARARVGAAVITAFVSGLVFASAADLTRFSWAQQGARTSARPSAQEVKPLADFGSAFEAIAEHVTPAVVSIQTERVARAGRRTFPRGSQPGIEEFFRQFEAPQQDRLQEGSGSGFIVSRDGYILTNNHVVADADRVTVGLLDKRTFTARVVGRDPTTDIAVVKIDAGNLPVASLGDDANARVGQWVLAIGNPLQLDFTVTAGIISSKGRSLRGLLPARYAITDYIQTDAAINPGNSGGPLVNIRGEVIGVNSAIASQTGFYAGYGFAIPISLAKQVMEDLIAHGRVRRAVLGVAIDDVNAEAARAAGLREIEGVLVQSYSPSAEQSPAAKAGIELGDVIVAVDGKPTPRVNTLQRIIRTYEPGQTVSVDVYRFGAKRTFRVRLAEPPSDEEQEVAAGPNSRGQPRVGPAASGSRSYDKLGITAEPVPEEFATQGRIPTQYRRGLLVTDVSLTGPARNSLVEGTDIIVRVLNPQPARDIRSATDLVGVLDRLRTGDLVTLLVYDARPQAASTKVVTLRVER
jgi:serine protease Do